MKMLFERGNVNKGQILPFSVARDESYSLDIARLLLDLGALVNKRMYEDDPYSWALYKVTGLGTPLHQAAADGRIGVVSLLLRQGADRTIRDTRGKTALELAEENGHETVVKILRN